MTEKPVRVFGYVRQSKTEEADESHSIAAQEHAIRDHVTEQGYILVDLYIDADLSAHVESIAKRPAFKRMLDAIANHEAEAVIVHELSRWSRNIAISAQASKTLDQNNATLISIKDSIDRTTASGRLFVNLMASIHEFYSDNLGEHMEKATSQRLLK